MKSIRWSFLRKSTCLFDHLSVCLTIFLSVFNRPEDTSLTVRARFFSRPECYKIFEKWDQNNNGRRIIDCSSSFFSRPEYYKIFEKWDQNNNGRLTKEELGKAVGPMAEVRALHRQYKIKWLAVRERVRVLDF